MIVTGTGADTELGKISGMLAATAKEESPLTKELDRLTLWIAAAAGLTMIVMFVLGRSAGEAWDVLFVSAVALAIAAIPEALPDRHPGDPVARQRRPGQAQRDRQGPAVGRDARVHLGDQLRQDRHADDEPDDGRRGRRRRPTATRSPATGYGLEGKVHHAAGSTDAIEDAILPYLVANDAKLVDGKVVGDPTEGALLVLALQGRARHRRHPRAAAAAGHAAVRPDVQADGDVQPDRRRVGQAGRAVLREGRGAGGHGPRGDGALADGRHRPVGRRPAEARPRSTWTAWRSDGQRVMAAADAGPRPGRVRPDGRPAGATSPTCR